VPGAPDGDGGYRLVKTLAHLQGAGELTAIADYDAQGRPMRATFRQDEGSGEDQFVSEQTVDLGTDGTAKISSALGPMASFERSISVLDRAQLEFDELWLFRLGHSPLTDGASGAFGRVEIGDPFEISNWVRQIPVRVNVASTTVSLPGEPSPVAAFAISAVDEDGKTKVIVIPGRGVVEAQVKTRDSEISIRRLDNL
jgi:hypothetical protein